MKRFITIGLLCLALVIGAYVGAGSAVVKAAEGNDSYDKATQIFANTKITSSLNAADDADWYRYEVKDSVGSFFVELKSSNMERGNLFDVTVYEADEDGMPKTTLKTFYTYDKPEAFSSWELSYAKGTVLLIKVCGSGGRNSNAVGVDYYLTVNFSNEPEKNCEWAIENNNSYENATKLTSATRLCGLLNSVDDVDWYKYEVKNDGKFKFTFKSTNMEKSNLYDMTVYEVDEDGYPTKKLKTFYTYSKPENFESDEYSYSKGTVIYLKVTGSGGKNSNANGVRYILYVTDTVDNSSSVTKGDNASKLDTPYSILAGTNVVVGKAEAGATVYVKYGKKTYNAVADSNGIYRVVTAKLTKGKSVKIWQKSGKTTSKKSTVKVVEKY